jgi:hypothetical protein
LHRRGFVYDANRAACRAPRRSRQDIKGTEKPSLFHEFGRLREQSPRPLRDNQAMTEPLPYKRILVKISGEGLMGSSAYGINNETLLRIAAGVSGHRRR